MSLISNFTPVSTALVTHTTQMTYESGSTMTTPAVLVTQIITSTPKFGGTKSPVEPASPLPDGFYWLIIAIGVVVFMLVLCGCCYFKLKRNR